MAILHAMVLQLQNEGIVPINDLIKFDKDTLAQVVENLKQPGDRVPSPNPVAKAGSMILRPPYTFGAKSHKCLLATCELVSNYDTATCT